jgi:hypothetical protein
VLRYLLKLENGEPADPRPMFISDRASWEAGHGFAARDGSCWRIVAVDAVSAPQAM